MTVQFGRTGAAPDLPLAGERAGLVAAKARRIQPTGRWASPLMRRILLPRRRGMPYWPAQLAGDKG